MRTLTYALIAILFTAISCGPSTEKQEDKPEISTKKEEKVVDKHTFAKPDQAVMTHLDLDVAVDFDTKVIAGTATLTIKKTPETGVLFIDTRDLTIEKVTSEGKDIPFKVHPEVEHLGEPLEIELEENTKLVTIHYKTSPKAEALQWLDKSQTAGKRNPFLFTQSQAILARTWVPCQDSPGIRFTYNAKVQVPKDLLAVMSAANPQEKTEDGIYHFKMEQPIPAYLLALAVGDLEFQSLGARSGIYAEPSLVEKSAYEFADMEKMIAAAEALYGPYQWERYDIIVLPPSFPFGGMENPRLTFATPTIIAGDRSLVALIAHELAHSWSGNLVTNATWDDFWLNEGFTVYFENRIMESMYGKPIADMLAMISYEDLGDMVAALEKEGKAYDSRLKLDLTGRNPDDGVTPIAYDKGFFLLKLIENTVGREKWDAFLKNYFETNKFKTMTTEKFITYLDENLLSKVEGAKEKIGLEEWIYNTGLPDNCPKVESERITKLMAEVERFKAGTKAADLKTEGWVYQEWWLFLQNLPEKLTAEQMQDLDATFKLTENGNSEVVFQWLMHVIRNEYKPAYKRLEEFCYSVGRRKFIQPLYAEMMKFEATQAMAKRIYKRSRKNYHFVATNSIDPIVGHQEG
ncbi:MAG: M1 family metallopeptidase [Flammeovirgaceae bacterium]